MKKINAIDLDKTLLPYDSVRSLVLKLFMVPGLSARVFIYSALRKAGLMSRKEFLRLITGLLRGRKDYDNFIGTFTERLFRDLSADILALVRKNSDAFTVNVLCTASPSDYAARLAERLGWDCVCSRVEKDSVSHAYGDKKKALFLEKYPAADYTYNFAVSDCKSDLGLLKLFSKYKIV